MASAGSIYIDLLLRDGAYSDGLKRASRNTKTATTQWSRDFSAVGGNITAIINPIGNVSGAIRNLSGVIAASFSINKLVQYSDQWKQLQGRLSLVVGEMGNIGGVQNELAAIAERTRQPLEGIYSFYSRLAQFVPDVERAQYDLLGVTESVASALAITGENAASSSGAMIQFTQAIGTNFEAAGQELRSLQEQAPRLTKALMNALGDGTKSLQQLKDEGKLTRETVLNALSGIGEEGRKLREELAKLPPTVSQAFTTLENSFIEFIGKSQTINEAVNDISKSIIALSGFIRNLANDSNIAETALFGLTAKAIDFYRAYNEQAVKVAKATNFFGLRDEDVKGYEENVRKALAARQRLEDELFASKQVVDPTGLIGPVQPGKTTPKPRPTTPPVVTTKQVNDIDQLIKSLRQESDLLDKRVELYGQDKSAVDEAIRRYQTYARIKESNVKLDSKQNEQIEIYLKNIAKQEEALESLNKEQERIKKLEDDRRQALEDLGNVIGSFFEDAITNGGKLSDVLDGLQQDIIRIIARLTVTKPLVEAIGSSLGGGSDGGFLGSLGDLFGSILPSYDVGAWRVNGDQVAQIHDGEMIIPSNEAEMLRRGTSSSANGGGFIVNIYNYGNSDVRTQEKQGTNGMEVDVFVDQMVATKLATQGSQTNMALSQRDRRALVRR